MKDCHLCARARKMFKEFNMRYKEVYDNPRAKRTYPYITITYNYKEICNMISNGVIGDAIHKRRR